MVNKDEYNTTTLLTNANQLIEIVHKFCDYRTQ